MGVGCVDIGGGGGAAAIGEASASGGRLGGKSR